MNGGAHEEGGRAAAEGRPRLSVAAPCYNEVEGIEAVVREWDEVLSSTVPSSEIVLCNDGSTDGTGDVLQLVQSACPRLRVVHNPKNGGYGRALACAVAATRGEYVVTIDSDGQFDLADASRLLRHLESGGYDGVSGRRLGKKDSAARVVADRALNRVVRLMFGTRLGDTNCAIKVVKGDLLRALRIEASGYPTPTEICLRLEAAGARLGESGVTHRPRTAGQSKLHPWRTAWNFLRFLLYLRYKLSLQRAGVIAAA